MQARCDGGSRASAAPRLPKCHRRRQEYLHGLMQRRRQRYLQRAVTPSPMVVAALPVILATTVALLASTADALMVPAISPVRAAPTRNARIVGNSADLLDIHFSFGSEPAFAGSGAVSRAAASVGLRWPSHNL